MMKSKRTLVVAAHPDDDVLGCGGTIAKLRDGGCDVRVVFLAEGITARYDPPEFERQEVRKLIEQRNANAYKALAVLGVARDRVYTSERYCCRLDQVPVIELSKEIEHHLSEFMPDRVFSHAPHDVNIDHQVVHKAVLAALRPVSEHRVAAFYVFEVLSSTEWNPLKPFLANAFVDISASIDRKIEAMAAYGDEMRQPPHPRSEEIIRSLARLRGAQAGVGYAEAFTLIRSLDI